MSFILAVTIRLYIGAARSLNADQVELPDIGKVRCWPSASFAIAGSNDLRLPLRET
jgi:hypothetical protein